ncbi:hypothetical protein BCV72DRAFT_283095 [Rhizopus microsporus var. microsporus]|uniref:C2H2-type domain-containing protein n=1 Tax=Rhizopus microsporus var. microsporus TaxID=86635 RepID=A0A1X0QMA6_RHIZD|nr:hypothetical protein BCV72DRAFT_283095 [Rhizopus microsporus var. microsporus]
MAQQIAQQYAIIQHQQVVNEHILQSQQSAQSVQPQSQPMPIQHQFLMNNDPGQPPAVPSQETPHVVLSQMSMLSPSSPNPSLVNNLAHANGNTTATTTPVAAPTSSLQNAIFHQHIHRSNFVNESNKRPATGQPTLIERKKSRRHTVSNGQPPVLSIDTKDIPALSSSPRSAVVLVPAQTFTRSEERKAFIDQQKKSLGTIKIPPPPTPQELGMVQSASAISAKDYEGLTRAQLISRLIKLETEKIQNDNSDNKEKDEEEDASPSDNQESKADSATIDEDKSTVDEEEEEEEESVVEEEPKTEKMQCKWRDCGIYLDELQKLITHINTEHVGSGKASYSCEWENCPRKEKPFTKRHKMYNHLRTHTGERPFVCTQDGCGKKFSRPDSLTTHIKTHSNVRPYTCYVKNCGKSYYHARSLRKHEKTHEESPTAMLSTPNSNIQYSGVSPAATSTNSTPFSNNMPGHIQVDYLNSPIQHSPLPVQTPSLPNSPHPPVPQQQQQNFTMLQSQTSSPVNKPYTPPNHMLSFSPAGMVEQQQQQNNELSINQQQQQLLDSVNQQHNTAFGYGQQQ